MSEWDSVITVVVDVAIVLFLIFLLRLALTPFLRDHAGRIAQMKESFKRTQINKLAIPIMVIGGALTAFGLSAYHGSYRGSGWDDTARIEIVAGVALFIFGLFYRK